MNISLPYDRRFLNLSVDEKQLRGVLIPAIHNHIAGESGDVLVSDALGHPIGSPRLRELAQGREKILVITSDHTRPMPSKTTLPLLLDEIRKGAPGAEIRILIATGMHRAMTASEMEDRFGKEMLERETFLNHDSRDIANTVFKGTLPSGGELRLNSLVDWADLTVSEGFIEPHFFAGFSGGRKSVLPGIASEKTVRANHCASFIADPEASAGSLENNPIHRDMLFAAEQAKLAFILNVTLDADKRIVGAFAGHPERAHEAGCEFMRGMCAVGARGADIVVSTNGGYPLDQNLYQAVKGMTAAEACARTDSVIVMVAACSDGHGGENFVRFFKNASSPQDVLDTIGRVEQRDTAADQWEAQILARILVKHPVIFVAQPSARPYVESMFMSYASDVAQALRAADRIKGAGAPVTVVPDGVSVIVRR